MGMRLIALSLLAAVSATAQTDTWDLGHPDAKLMMGINLKNLRASALGEAFRSQMRSQPLQMGQAGMALGFLEQIDRVFISSPALSKLPTKLAGKGAPRENPPFLVIVEGTLPVQQLLAFLPGSLQRYRTVDVFRGAKPTDPSIAMLDTRTTVLGDNKSVLAAIDRRAHTVQAESTTLARARQLASTHDFWVLATDSLSQFQPSNANLPSAFAADMKGIDAGFTFRDGMQMELSLTMTSEMAAAQLYQLVSGQIALAQTQNPDMAEAARKLRIASQGNQLRASISLSKDEVEEQLRKFQAARAGTGIAVGRPPAQLTRPSAPRTPRLQTTNPPPPPPGKVRIYGLDEGVREIPLSK